MKESSEEWMDGWKHESMGGRKTGREEGRKNRRTERRNDGKTVTKRVKMKLRNNHGDKRLIERKRKE